MELKQVLLALGSAWDDKIKELEELLRTEGICCGCLDRDRMEKVRRADTLVITDDRALSAELAKCGIVCIGCDAKGDAFFEGATLVTDAPESLDVHVLEACLLRALGRPVTIVKTQRLVIREIMEQDLDELARIDRHFEPEKMRAYIRHAYRFFGYGLWSVLLHGGTLIGCCGFTDYAGRHDRQEASDGQGESVCLELQYVVAEQFRRRGYGEEMCRAALRYAYSRLQADEVWIRMRADNQESEGLAKKLGFVRVCTDGSGILHFRKNARAVGISSSDGICLKENILS